MIPASRLSDGPGSPPASIRQGVKTNRDYRPGESILIVRVAIILHPFAGSGSWRLPEAFVQSPITLDTACEVEHVNGDLATAAGQFRIGA